MLNQQNVAVFGGTGFVGSYILESLVRKKYHPVILARAGSEKKIQINRGLCHTFSGSINNLDKIKRILEFSNSVIYNIGIIREFPRRGISFEQLHFFAVKKIIDLCPKYGIKRFVLMSANGVELDKTGYQYFKLKAEEYLKQSDLDWTIFRPSVVFGNPNGKMEFCTELKEQIIKLPFPAPLFFDKFDIFNAGNFQFSPIHVENVADFFVKSLSRDEAIKKTFELGGLDSFSWKEILVHISNAARIKKFFVPAPVISVKLAAFFFERFEFFPISRDQITMLLEGNTCDSKEYFKEFDIEPKKFNADNLEYLNEV